MRQRRYSRQSSAASHCSADHDLQMISLRQGDGTGSIGARKRTPSGETNPAYSSIDLVVVFYNAYVDVCHLSGKSVQSRTISLAEYHQDLKPELKQVRLLHCWFTMCAMCV